MYQNTEGGIYKSKYTLILNNTNILCLKNYSRVKFVKLNMFCIVEKYATLFNDIDNKILSDSIKFHHQIIGQL